MRTFLRIIAINFFGCSIVFIAAELVFGGWLANSGLVKLGIIRDRVIEVSTSDGDGTVSWGPHGFRNYFGKPKDIDIIVVGGSTTLERNIKDGHTWVDQLGEGLSLQLGKNLTVVNAGVDGQSTIGHIANFEAWFSSLKDFAPRYYIYYVGINDIQVDMHNSTKAGQNIEEVPHWWSTLINSEGPIINRLLNATIYYPGFFDGFEADSIVCQTFICSIRSNSILFHSLRKLKGYLLAKKSKLHYGSKLSDIATFTDQPLRTDSAAYANDLAQRFRKRLAALTQRTIAAGGQPIYVTQTSRIFQRTPTGKILGVPDEFACGTQKCNGVDQYFLYQAYAKTVMEHCSRHSLVCSDLFSNLNLDANRDFSDIIHTSPSGAKKVAGFLSKSLASLARSL